MDGFRRMEIVGRLHATDTALYRPLPLPFSRDFTQSGSLTACRGCSVASSGNFIACRGSSVASSGSFIACQGSSIAFVGSFNACFGSPIAAGGSFFAYRGSSIASFGSFNACQGSVVASAGSNGSRRGSLCASRPGRLASIARMERSGIRDDRSHETKLDLDCNPAANVLSLVPTLQRHWH